MHRKICHILVVAALLLGAARPGPDPVKTEFVLGTVCSISLFDQARADVYREIFGRLREIDNRMSVNLPDSDISLVNAAAGIAPVQVHGDVFDVIERALYFAELSGGAFDPTVGPLVSLWGIAGDKPRVPSLAEIVAVLPLVNWRDIELNRQQRSVFLKQPGMALDLGAIAKGYAADEAAAIISKAGIERAIIDLGGNIVTYGLKEDKSPWKVGLQNPLEGRGAYFGIVNVMASPAKQAQTVVTSGVYERYFEEDGVRYHHIFSPSGGYPATNGLASVTLIAENSMDADALSTAVFVLGYEQGRALVESLPGTEAVFAFDDLSVRKTAGANFTLSNQSFRLLQD
jgi:thiamine biosynthesis lipoprotein